MRYVPESWTGEFDFKTVFGHVPRRVEVDLGSGKGRFLLARASADPEVSFLGLDRLLLRIEKVERKVLKRGLNNVRLVYVSADYAVRFLIPRQSVSVYYIFFPDPWPKTRHHDRRLFDESFLDALAATLVPDGVVHVATDHQQYFREIVALFENNPLYKQAPVFIPSEEEKTDFELLFSGLGAKIGRCSFAKMYGNL